MPAIPKGSTVAITGLNGYIASHIADQLLAHGYAVRGSVRSADKGEAIKESLQKRHPTGKVDYVIVEDFSKPGAYDKAFEGCTGVAHVAAVLTFSPNPHEVVTPSIEAIKNVLASAQKADVKRFVMTSSSTAFYEAPSKVKREIDSTCWNDEGIDKIWEEPFTPDRGQAVYAAQKTLTEKAAWEFVREEKPGFVFNAVLPNFNGGEIINPNIWASSGSLMKGFFMNPEDPQALGFLSALAPQYYVDVQDVGKIHLAALVEEDVRNERLPAFGELFSFDVLKSICKKFNPSGKYPEPDENAEVDQAIVKKDRSIELLRRYGQDGFMPTEESLKRCFDSK